jgi:hypothetical protein
MNNPVEDNTLDVIAGKMIHITKVHPLDHLQLKFETIQNNVKQGVDGSPKASCIVQGVIQLRLS